jgi:3-hydroxyisobutyrate dehydrogenase-like beta-hydroxyacid dehydrogenase
VYGIGVACEYRRCICIQLLYTDSDDLLVYAPMGHIFISYSRIDTDYAHKLADALQGKGLDGLDRCAFGLWLPVAS